MTLKSRVHRKGGRELQKSITARELAKESSRDPDEVLVTLWDQGFDYLDDLDNQLQRSDVPKARRALGIVSPQMRRRLSFWQEALDLSPHELRDYMRSRGIHVSDGARQVPKGALKRFERCLREDPRWTVRMAKLEARLSSDVRENPQGQVDTSDFRWELVGRERDVRHLETEQVKAIHDRLTRDFANGCDPIDPPGLRDPGLLESAIGRPKTSLGGALKYPTVEMAAAALLHSVVQNHAFHNGNKRTALVSLLCFLDQNNLVLTCTEREIFKFVLRVAQHRVVSQGSADRADREVIEIAKWIRANSRVLDRSERPIKWRELKAILRAYDCNFSTPRTGNRLNISRTVEVRRGGFRRHQVIILKHQTHYPDDGREVNRGQLHELRKALRLDEENGVDSEVFYGNVAEVDDFIQRYRTVLRKLAGL